MAFKSTETLSIPEYQVSEGYVYVLKMVREDDEIFFYVGSTSVPVEKRIRQHSNGNVCRQMPVVRDNVDVLGDTSEMEFTLTGVERIVPVDSSNRDRLHEVERKIAYTVAIEEETTNISGVNP